jgi:hypothetical protein
MKIGDLVKVQYRFDWIEIGIVTAIMHHNQVKIHWNYCDYAPQSSKNTLEYR